MANNNLPPSPSGQVLSLISALSNTSNHELHIQAIRARDDALSSSPESYSNLCVQLGYLMVGSDQPRQLLQRLDPASMEQWKQTDGTTALRLQQDESMWIPFGQMAGLVLKNALLHPPVMAVAVAAAAANNNSNDQQHHSQFRPLSLMAPQANDVKATLLLCLNCQHAELRAVASSVIATCSVSVDGVQPALHLSAWPDLIAALVHNLQQQQQANITTLPSNYVVEGSLTTIRKMMEDGPRELSPEQLDALVPLLLRFLAAPDERSKVSALQSLIACHSDDMMPSALVLHFSDYLAGISALATDPSLLVRKWVCRSIVTLLELRTEYVQEHMAAISQFMLQQTNTVANNATTNNNPQQQHQTTSISAVALEACEFWLTFANLDDNVCPPAMVETVGALLPQLLPTLLRNMVYLQEQRLELQARNELDEQQEQQQQSGGMKPVFHKARNKHGGGNSGGAAGAGHDEDSDNDDDDDDDFDDDEGNEWTLRKCAAASLDSLANLYGAAAILPPLLPALEQGLSSSDPWVQEASILALGAIADGCRDEMNAHMAQLHPFLMNHLTAPESLATSLPQVKCIAAWTIGRYAAWAVEQVQTGMQGHLLAQMTEVFIQRLKDRNRKVQIACVSSFGVVMETAGDLMAPYLEPVFRALVAALARYQGRSLVILFDTLGIMADFVGPAIAEGHLPSIFVPPMMQMWDGLAKNDPTDRTLLPLMESIASIAMTSGMNFQPFALETFNNAMGMIEAVTLLLVTDGEIVENDEDADPIICATDVLDGLAEGLGGNFAALVFSSDRYGPQFASMLQTLCSHEIPGVRMSAFALLGDLARNAPAVIESALPQLLPAAISNVDPIQHAVCNNAVWAVGEICIQCTRNPASLEPYAAPLLQKLIALLMGNGVGMGYRGVNIPGLAENAAAAVGRLANVNPNFVAPDLPRFLLGWCDGMAKIQDPTERRDAFEGFIKAIYANPQCIQSAAANVSDAIASILFALVSWHMPPQEEADYEQITDILNGDYAFQPFPQHEAELGNKLVQLVREIKTSVGDEPWTKVQNQLPVNVRRLLREAYQL